MFPNSMDDDDDDDDGAMMLLMMLMIMMIASVLFQRIPTACWDVTARRTSQARQVSSLVHYGKCAAYVSFLV